MTASYLPLTRYFQGLYAVHAIGAGTPEESYYPSLQTLLEAVGEQLDPRVIPVAQPSGVKADYGLFTSDQVRDGEVVPGQLPSRGAIEAKPVDADLDVVIASDQVARYLDRYQRVLVTNYRAFAFVENAASSTAGGRPVVRERFELAGSPAELWLIASRPVATAKELGPRFFEFLQRVLRSGAPLRNPRDLAWFLASYAREARLVLESTSLDHLGELRSSLEEALDVRFADAKPSPPSPGWGRTSSRATSNRATWNGRPFRSW